MAKKKKSLAKEQEDNLKKLGDVIVTATGAIVLLGVSKAALNTFKN